jgi:hypothetical protein
MSIYGTAGSMYNAGGLVSTNSNPLTLPLVSVGQASSIFSNMGSFTVPAAFQFGAAAMSISGRTMYVAAIQQTDASLGAIQVPTPAQIISGGSAASTLVSPQHFSPTIGQNAGTNSTFPVAVGSIQYGGSVYITLGIFFNASTPNPQTGFMVKANTALTSISTAASPSGSVSSGPSMFGGPMGPIPTIWQPFFGGADTYVLGGLGLGITSTLSVGFGLSGTTLSSFVAGSPLSLNELCNYPYDGIEEAYGSTCLWNRPNVHAHISGTSFIVDSVDVGGTVMTNGATIEWATGSAIISTGGPGGVGTYTLTTNKGTVTSQPMWVSNTAQAPNGGSTGGNDLAAVYDGAIGYGFIIPNSRTFAYINIHHYGPSGTPGAGNCDTSASGSRDPRRMQITYYDLAALYNNVQASGNIYAIQPYGWEVFPNSATLFGSCPGVLPEGCYNGWATYDPVNQIFYCAPGGFGGSNLNIQAFSVTGI